MLRVGVWTLGVVESGYWRTRWRLPSVFAAPESALVEPLLAHEVGEAAPRLWPWLDEEEVKLKTSLSHVELGDAEVTSELDPGSG